MKYDFHTIPDRSKCGSTKWNSLEGTSIDNVPLCTADMEFPTAPPIVEGLKELLDTTILGYTCPTSSYYESIIDWMKRRHNYTVEADWIVTTPGVVYALGLLVQALSEPSDSVIVITPVYYPFDLAVMAKDRDIVYNELILNGERYEIDFEDLEEKASRPECKVLLFCNPHNPVGRVWTPEELERVVDICDRHGVFIIDDEIHHDLIMPGYKHTVMASLSEKANRITAVCTAPSKTFNLAGLQGSNIIIADPLVRAKAEIYNLTNLITSLNTFAYKACELAYNECEDWLEELLKVIDSNAQYVKDFMAEHFPDVKVFPLEGTYLLWLDMRGLGMTHVELQEMLEEDAKLYFSQGSQFGYLGRGFVRINLACSLLTLEKAMERFKRAVEDKRLLWEREGRPYRKTLAVGDRLEGFVYDTCEENGIELEMTIEKPTVLFFSRYYSCPACQMNIEVLKGSWEQIDKMGVDLKFVLQSTQETIKNAFQDDPLPFDIICDPKAVLYDRYNVFEADSDEKLVAGDSQALKAMGGARNMLFNSMVSSVEEGRKRQLSAVFVVNPDMTIAYAYYSRTLTDLPDFDDIIQAML